MLWWQQHRSRNLGAGLCFAVWAGTDYSPSPLFSSLYCQKRYQPHRKGCAGISTLGLGEGIESLRSSGREGEHHWDPEPNPVLVSLQWVDTYKAEIITQYFILAQTSRGARTGTHRRWTTGWLCRLAGERELLPGNHQMALGEIMFKCYFYFIFFFFFRQLKLEKGLFVKLWLSSFSKKHLHQPEFVEWLNRIIPLIQGWYSEPAHAPAKGKTQCCVINHLR